MSVTNLAHPPVLFFLKKSPCRYSHFVSSLTLFACSRYQTKGDYHDKSISRRNSPYSSFKSSSDTVVEPPDSTNSATPSNTFLHHQKQQQHPKPRTLFPWRHSSAVLPRINPNAVEYITQGGWIGPHMPPLNTLAQNILWMISCRALGISLFDLLITKRYQKQLEYSFVYAFQQAVNSLLIHTFHGM